MTLRRFLGGVFALGFLATAACGSGTVKLQVELLRKSCPGSDGVQVDALQDVSHLEFLISGDGIDGTVSTIAAVADGSVTLEEIPLLESGQLTERRIEVRAHFQSPQGPITARGLAVVQLDPSELNPPPIPVFLRPVDSYVYTADKDDPDTCTTMSRARAGHSATTLNDGRVLIVGGAEFDTLGGRTVHDSAEIFDPLTGQFELRVRGSGGPGLPRVFHSASKMQDGRVLVVGGEFDMSGTERDVLRPAEIFRPELGDDGEFDANALIANTGRTRHRASVSGDMVLISGGYTDPSPGTGHPIPIRATELFDGVAERFTVAPDLPEARAEHCATVLDRGVVVVAGGLTAAGNNVNVSNTMHFYRLSEGSATLLEQGGLPLSQTLSTGRYGMGCAAVRLGAGTETVMVMAGGYTTVDDFSASSSHPGVEVFNPSGSPQVTDAGSLQAGARGNLCAVAIDDNTAVFLGGFNSGDLPTSRGSEWASTTDGSVRIAQTTGRRLNEGRYLAACTRLLDGSVLVTGGLSPDAGGTPVSVRSAELYTPILR
ncbi:MAG: kelch repeat-containing protein [Deltaproteobacteria bacterium]|nr:kelch repeat-containing protein [Deltaproteobacteria bacterium]